MEFALCTKWGRAWGGDLIVFVGPGVGYLTDLALPGEGVFECFFTQGEMMGSIERFKIQWNPVNMVTNGPKTIWPYYQDWLKFHDLRAIMTNTPYIAFTILFSLINNQNVDITYSIEKNYFNFSFSTPQPAFPGFTLIGALQ